MIRVTAFLVTALLALAMPLSASADGLSDFDQYGVTFTGVDPRFDDALLWDVQEGYPTNSIPHGHFSWLFEHRGWTHEMMLGMVGKSAIVEVFKEVDEHGAEHHVIRLPANEAYLTVVSRDEAMSGPALGDNYCHLEGNACDKFGRRDRGSRDANRGSRE